MRELPIEDDAMTEDTIPRCTADVTTQGGLRIMLTIPINGPLMEPGNEPC